MPSPSTVKTKAYEILVGEPKDMRALENLRRRSENIKML